MKMISENGCIPKSSTTHALLSMVHSWIKHTDRTGSTVRVVLFDYKKAFELIDHRILANKLTSLDLPHSTLCWIIDFLKNGSKESNLVRIANPNGEIFQQGSPKALNWARGSLF